MSAPEDLNIHCDPYVVRALEIETWCINHQNTRAGLQRVDISEVAREVLATWAIKRLLSKGMEPPAVIEQVSEPMKG